MYKHPLSVCSVTATVVGNKTTMLSITTGALCLGPRSDENNDGLEFMACGRPSTTNIQRAVKPGVSNNWTWDCSKKLRLTLLMATSRLDQPANYFWQLVCHS